MLICPSRSLYASISWVTHHLLSVVMILLQERLGGQVSQGLTWSDGSIHVFPCSQHLSQFR